MRSPAQCFDHSYQPIRPPLISKFHTRNFACQLRNIHHRRIHRTPLRQPVHRTCERILPHIGYLSSRPLKNQSPVIPRNPDRLCSWSRLDVWYDEGKTPHPASRPPSPLTTGEKGQECPSDWPETQGAFVGWTFLSDAPPESSPWSSAPQTTGRSYKKAIMYPTSVLSTFKVGVELYLYDGLPVRRR